VDARCSLSRRRFVQGVDVVGLGLLAGRGRFPGQAQPVMMPHSKLDREDLHEVLADVRRTVLRRHPDLSWVPGARTMATPAA
jgi:hypothetical protein